MKLSVIIVNYNVKHYLGQCLDSVQRAIKGMDAEVYVVDNHSRDGSVDYLCEHFPWVHYVASNHNLGFSRANNIAIRQSKSDYVLLLNPDTVVGEQVLSESVAFMDKHPEAGTLGVRMLNPDGSNAMESRRGLPSPMVAFYKMTGLCARFPQSHRFGKYYMNYLSWEESAAIEVVSGAYCLLRRKALDKVGLLDEDFFMYGEDIDLSCRILKAGYQNWYLPQKILHYKGESTQKSSFRYVHVFYDAMLIFFRKHYGHLSLLLGIPIKAAIYLRAAWAAIQMVTDRMRMSLGFSLGRRIEPEYLFLGKKNAIEECRKLAQVRALSFHFIECDESALPDGHLSASVAEKTATLACRKLVVVYDVEAYSYQRILDNFSAQPQPQVTMGTYHLQLKTLITQEEVIL